MASHVKGFLTALVAMFVFTGCLIGLRYIPESFLVRLNVWWIGFLALTACIFIYYIADSLASKSSSGFACFLLKGFIHPVAIFSWFAILIVIASLESISELFVLSNNVLSFSSWISAIIAFVIVLFFAIIYSSIKENGGFARFIFMIAILALIYGVFAFFTYLVKDVITIPSYVSVYAYAFFFFYLNDYAVYEVCEDNKFQKRRNTLTRIVSVIKKI